jgi:hypothetical protein
LCTVVNLFQQNWGKEGNSVIISKYINHNNHFFKNTSIMNHGCVSVKESELRQPCDHGG